MTQTKGKTHSSAGIWRGACLAAALLLGAGAVQGQTVFAGYDLHGTAFAFKDFAYEPIPAGFFGTGSNPYTGKIHFKGKPLTEYNGYALPTPTPTAPERIVDTIIWRMEDASLSGPGSQDTIAAKMVVLSLVSKAPVEITYAQGGMEQWDVEASVPNNPAGTIVLSQTSPSGGILDAKIPIHPVLRFRRRTDGAIRTLNTVAAGFKPIILTIDDLPWSFGPVTPPPSPDHDIARVPGLTTNFVPAYSVTAGRSLSCGISFTMSAAHDQPRGAHGHFAVVASAAGTFQGAGPGDCL
jgi:hypothetical protein